ncbi:MAG: tagaturonate reductase, partial [Pedobacter sp.]
RPVRRRGPTDSGGTDAFEQQDALYTICVRGIENGIPVEENIISSSISRVVSAVDKWDEILKLATKASLKLIISNTTEVGITLVNESIHQNPPVSFPAKLLAVLYSRYKEINSDDADIVIIATELIPDNGKVLESIVYKLADFNKLEPEFFDWLKQHAFFCNSLVDRIIPGKPDGENLGALESSLGYKDNLLIMAEPYRLWAIEADEKVAQIIDLESSDPGVIIKPDIEIYRELKVRLLNGTHTLASGIAYLSGIDTVSNAMNNQLLKSYIKGVMLEEIVPAIPYEVDHDEAVNFSHTVLDRFANPYINHLWINITLQYSMKMKIRIIPVLIQYYKNFGTVPESIAFGFAAYLTFMRASIKKDNQYYGIYQEKEYLINDDQASYFYDKADFDDSRYIQVVTTDESLWGVNLSDFKGFIDSVEEKYHYITKHGITAGLSRIF